MLPTDRTGPSSVHLAPALLASMIVVAGCETTPAVEFVQAPEATAGSRELQTRRFDGVTEEKLLGACAGILQDLGFTIQGAYPELGMLRGTKEREAKAPEQRAAHTILVILLALAAAQSGHASSAPVPPATEEQTIRVLVITQPVAGRNDSHDVRVTFHRFLRQPLTQQAGALHDPKLYEAFFELLSKALFLEAHKL